MRVGRAGESRWLAWSGNRRLCSTCVHCGDGGAALRQELKRGRK